MASVTKRHMHRLFGVMMPDSREPVISSWNLVQFLRACMAGHFRLVLRFSDYFIQKH